MSVYFVTRSHYEGPAGKKVQRFGEDTLLTWFQNRWVGIADAEDSELAYFFREIAESEETIPPPTTEEELANAVGQHLHAQGEILYVPHCLQVLDDDDELEFAHYLFDDVYLAANRDKVAFLLHDDWRLPTSAGSKSQISRNATLPLEPAGTGEGATYLVFLSYYDSGNLTDLEGGYRIAGARLPELARHLAQTPDELPGEEWPFEMTLLRELALLGGAGITLENLLKRVGQLPFEDLSNQADYSAPGKRELRAVLKDMGVEVRPYSPNFHSLVQSDDHLAQLCLHTATWGKTRLYHRWIFFDDLWLAANRAMGEAILNCAARWDVLS